MAQIQDRNQLAFEEQLESPLTGPFGGIQSELPPTEIEDVGFVDCRNMILRLGRADVRPSYTALPPFPSTPSEPIMGIANFYNADGAQIQCVFTPTKLWQFVSGGWTQITGPAFTGSATDLFSWDVLDYKLCFSQGADIIWIWDGLGTTYSQSSASAPAASLIAEIGQHLFAVSPSFPQTYYWSGTDNPTSWNPATDFTVGSNTLVNNLGPINGLIKLGQYGFGFHQNGIVVIVPTGNGAAPFAFYPIINAPQGTTAPFSIARIDEQGVDCGVYLGSDNVYVFNGSSIQSIGDQPLTGRKRQGARSRILSDVLASNPLTIYGFVTYAINGNPFRAYWLVIPGVAVWVYNFDEGNWTVFTYTSTISTIGEFFKNSVITIAELIGTIQAQSWTPATLTPNNPFNGLLLGFNNGVAGYIDFTNYSEVAASITSGKLIFGDRRHKHTIKYIRVSVYDKGATTYSVTLTNEKGISQTQPFTLGSGSGDVLNYIVPFTLNGLRFQWVINIAAGQPGSIVEIAPIFDIAGAQRSGTIDN